MSVFASKIISQLLRIGLLSVFALGIFLSLGDISIDHGSLSYGINNTYAATGETAPQKDTISTTISGLIDLGNLFIGVLTFLITPLIMLAGWLLSPDWTFGEIFGLRPILHQVWIFISNVVYVIFGFMLVGIAFANIFGAGGGEYEMKKMLPKLVTGILIVPFTWFIVSAVLAVSNILVASVISLPMETIMKAGGSSTTKMFDDKIIPKKIVYNKNVDYGTGNTLLGYTKQREDGKEHYEEGADTKLIANGNFYASDCDVKDTKDCLSIQEFLTQGGGGAYNLLSVYAYGIFKIQHYKIITTGQKIGKFGDIAQKLSFGFIFFVIFGILVIAIVYALLSRAIMLWMFAMFSPLFALSYVLGHGKGKLQEKVANYSLGHFISLAMVPVYVAAALAFGLMFLGLVMNKTSDAQGGNKTASTDSVLKGQGVEITTNATDSTFAFGQVSLTTKGLLTSESNENLSGALNMGKGIIGTIIMNILALVILWMAVMAALSADHITEHAIKPIADMGNSVGELAKHSPSYIPIPGLQGQSMKSITQGTTLATQGISNIATGKANEFNQKFGLDKYRELSTAVSNAAIELKKVTQGAGGGDPNVQATASKIAEAMQKGENIQNLSQQANFRDLINDFGKKIGVEDDKLKNLNTRDGLTKALNAIEHKIEPGGTGGIFHGITATGSNVTHVDIDNFIKNGKGAKADASGGSGKLGDELLDKKDDSKKVRVDQNTIINITAGKVGDNDIKDLVTHMKNDIKTGNMTESDFKKWAEDLGIKNTEDILKKIGEITDKDGKKWKWKDEPKKSS